jgi:SNF family Na+-dependent transporter
MSSTNPKESWNSRIGIILAVSGSAVGLGNFLRFPGLAAKHGGGAFMLAYFVSFLIIGLSICWAEWAMGRAGGQKGRYSSPGIIAAITGRSNFKYLGVLGVLIPVMIYTYYVYIESWCLGYSVNFLAGNLDFQTGEEASAFFGTFVGAGADGSAFGFGIKQVGWFLICVFILNFILIYRGLSRGIELFCKYAMPALMILAVVVLIRVLTIGTPDASKPDLNVINGLGYMWNPVKTIVESQDADGIWSKMKQMVY